MFLSRLSYLLLPQEPGIYIFLDKKSDVLYIGKAKNLKNRVSSYFQKTITGEKTRALVDKIESIRYIRVASEVESLLLEANYIKKFAPKYNIRLSDGKAYPLIRITIKDTFPKVLLARRMEDSKSVYFGPYPNVKAMKMVLRTIRRIFPFQSIVNHGNRPCLYYHLELCPCPEVFKDKNYKKDIAKIIKIFSGKTTTLIRDLEKEMQKESKDENFEKAKALKSQIQALELIIKPTHTPFEYDANPNLISDIRELEMTELQAHLKNEGLLVEKLERIECYDISNTSGKQSVGSMAVFTNGEKDSSQYRRFKIYKTMGPNDFAMHQEVLRRRLVHKEWPYPNLIIIDGGKGQVSSTIKILNEVGVDIPLIGIAKREEELVIPSRLSLRGSSALQNDRSNLPEKFLPTEFVVIRLPRNSKALHLVMRIRDEAHRFAITYHKKLRSKFVFS